MCRHMDAANELNLRGEFIMRVELDEKVAIVTGGGGFIGSAICQDFAKNGALVFVQGRDEAKIAETVRLIKESGGSAYPLVGDVTDAKSVQSMTSEAFDRFKRIDILINNAGINTGFEDRVTVDKFNDETWDRIISVDLEGVYLCSKYVSRHMIEANSGRIINIGSVAGVVALRLQSAFVAAKSGMFGLTRAMAAELGQYGIQVNAIAPGSITNARFNDAKNESLLSHIPLGRQGSASEVSAAALFLAAPEASYISGAMLTVDGGWTCGFMRDW